MQYKAQIIGGSHGEIIARQKSDADLELGELLIGKNKEKKTLFQVHDIFFSSQISMQNLEKISGMELEENANTTFFNSKTRNYTLAKIKALINIGKNVVSSKSLPRFFSKLREVTKEDLSFLSKSKNPLFLGNLRSGTKSLDLPINLDGEKILSHHMLITGTTGRGKSVLMKNLIWSCIDSSYAAQLIFDPHDEYYGKNSVGMKDHPNKNQLIYYTTKDVPTGQRTLSINLKLLRPDHFEFLDLSSPQRQIIYLYYKKFKENWIKNIFSNESAMNETNNKEINEMSLAVLRRKLRVLLDIEFESDLGISTNGIFSGKESGLETIKDITRALENGKTVIVDTSSFSGTLELLIANMLTSDVFNKYKYYNTKGLLKNKPVINIVLEEAPRVLGKDVLEQGPNIFSTIAREGRKFKIGISAITQLPSLIPKEVLANMNTKIILGTEMNTERRAIIESASQDLSSDDRNIAGLDKGEAIISSTFTRFALPIRIPFFDDRVKEEQRNKKSEKKSFPGIKLQ